MEVDSSTRISQAQNAAAKAEREAAERITQAQKHIREAGREEEVQLNHLRDQYTQRSDAERIRGDDYLEAVRQRNYDSVGEVRRKGENEIHRVTRDSDLELKKLNRTYSEAKASTTHKGETELKDATKQNYLQEEQVRRGNEERLGVLKKTFSDEKAAIEATRRDTVNALEKASQEHRKETEEKTQVAVENSDQHYREAYEGAIRQNQDALADLNWKASKEVETLKRETTQKLDAYTNQKEDPFYRMVNVDGKLTEHENAFVFTAKIPEHERERININIHGNELVISGKRKSEEALEVAPGRTVRTNSYQSFSENFPLNFPVDPKSMTREFDGETLVVRIPKRTTYEAVMPKPVVERARLTRPNFPKNLPGEAELAKLNDPGRGPDPQDENTPPSKRRKTGTVLGS